MGGSHSKLVAVDISRYPGIGKEAQKDKGGYYYTDQAGGRVNLTDEWYPDPEGTYRKFTHTPKGGKISKITHKENALSEFPGLSGYPSVSVYYWAQDNTFSNPLLIQLGEGDNYYITTNSRDSWDNDNQISTTNLKKNLDEQNCTRNQAHIVDLSQKQNSSTTYQCPSCTQKIPRVYYSSGQGTPYYGHYIPGSGSVSGFKYNKQDQVGLLSLKDRDLIIRVYWDNSETKPIFILYQTRQQRYFRKNAGNVKSWIEVTDAITTTLTTATTPTITTLDLSRMDGTYSGGSTNIKMAVLLSHIGDGCRKFEHSLRGAPFTVKSVSHGTTQLTGISSNDPLVSVSAYYYGYTLTDKSNLLLVELRSSSGGTTYQYFYRDKKDGNNWTEYLGPDGKTGKQLVGSSLKQTLDAIKKTQFPEASKDATTIIVGSSVGSGLGGTGLGGLAVWVWYKYFFDPVVRLV